MSQGAAPAGEQGKDNIDLTGKVALITGANQGIGWAVAQMLARHGARVVVNYPDISREPEDLSPLGPDAMAIKADVGDVGQIGTMFAALESEIGRLDILVNNAGIFPRAGVFEMDEAIWDAVLGVNLKGSFFCAQEAARIMARQGSGRIVNLASVSSVLPDARGIHYTASKAGVIALTKSLALALAPHGIQVNAVGPGVTDTAQPRYGLSEEEMVAIGAANPLGRIAQPEDIARAVLYLVSDLSTYVTGQTLFVTGGSFMSP